MKRNREEDKTAIPERRLKQVSNHSRKATSETTVKEGAKNGSNTSQKHKTARTEQGGEIARASKSSAAQTVNMTQLSDILQSSPSTAFAGLTETIKTGFINLGRLIQDTKITEDNEV